ncbi:MAG: CDP-diacylglycerol--serine O-phosphatidyltransferase, partial [Zhongshania aliphaticivorans]
MTEQQGNDKPKSPFDTEALLLIDDHEEEVSVNGKTERKRGIYLLPNLFTTAALFAGFFAIISGMHGNFENAAIAIFAAMIFDGLD